MSAIPPDPIEVPVRTRSLIEKEWRRYTPRQEEILAHLEHIFAVRGFRAVMISDLAEELRCSRRTLYALARTKEELFLLVIDRMFRRLGERAIEVLASDIPTEEQIEILICDSIPILRPGGTNFLLDLEGYAPAYRLFVDHVDSANEVIASLISVGVTEGQFRPVDPRLLAGAIRAAVTYVASPDAMRSSGLSEVDAVRMLTQVMLRGIVA